MYAEYSKKLKELEQLSPLTSELFGDEVSLYTGQTSFSVVDIDLPGNNALPVQLRRTLDVSLLSGSKSWDPLGSPGNPYTGLGNWAIDVPQIHGVFDGNYKWNRPNGVPSGTVIPRCSQYFLPGVENESKFKYSEVASGISVHIPGAGDKSLLIGDGTSTPVLPYPSNQVWRTKDFDRITCTQTQNGGGEGFVLTTTDGVSYTFDWYLERFESTLEKDARFSTENTTFYNTRLSIHLLATRVEDRHGNWVQYTYDAAKGGYPTAIESGGSGESGNPRKIELQYEEALIPGGGQMKNIRLKSATVQLAQIPGVMASEERVWNYVYDDPADGETSRLRTVSQPDRSSWKYSYIGDQYVRFELNDDPALPCPESAPQPSNKTFGVRMEHPAGAIGVFSFKYGGQSSAVSHSEACRRDNPGGVPGYADYLKLDTKQVYYSADKSDLWKYETGMIDFLECGRNCEVSRSLVTLPDGGVVQYEFSRRYNAMSVSGVAEGRLLATSTYSDAGSVKNNDPPLRSEVNTYVTGVDTNGVPLTGFEFPARYGDVFMGDPAVGSLRPLKKVTITQQGTTFVREHTKFDTYGRPTKTVRQGPQGLRKETTEYADHEGRWVLGQILKIKDETLVVDGVAGEPSFEGTIVSNTYDPDWADLTSVREYGRLVREMTYRVGLGGDSEDGTLKTIKDGATPSRTTTLGTFHRGIPQSVTYADGTSQSAVIDDAGSIRSVTNEVGATTSYGYDKMGRVTNITYPDDTNPIWNSTTIDYERVDATEAGVSGLHWRQTTKTGDARRLVVYDGRWRPVSTTEYDATNKAATTRRTARTFDYANREIFVSYPVDSDSKLRLDGTSTQYDTLGRVLTVEQSDGSAVRTTTTAYSLDAFSKTVTDPALKVTTTRYQAFDTPTEDFPTDIELPESVTVKIVRDRFGHPMTVTRSGTYEGRPLAATRRYAYDANLRLCATTEPESGTTVQDYDGAGNVSWIAKGTAVSGCLRNNVAEGDKTKFGYDPRNRVTSVTYPGGAASIAKEYWGDGALRTATSNGAKWTYGYNRRGLLTSESLQYDGQTFLLERTYDKNGSLEQLMYPDDTIVPYAPNALGQPTRAGDYATGVAYHPNGAMSGFTYGNTIVHSLTLDGRQLPLRSKDGTVTELEYGYDANANVSSITDKQVLPIDESRRMEYDGLNRLVKVEAPGMWGVATFKYDPLDNLRSSEVDIRTCTHAYDESKNLLASIAGANCPSKGYFYDARGNVRQRGGQVLEFDRADRLVAADREYGSGKENYTYDAHGHRVRVQRTADNSKLYQVYSLDGQLLHAVDTATDKPTNYIYLNGSLVARREGRPDESPTVPPIPAAPTADPNPSATGRYKVRWLSVGATGYVLAEQANGGSEQPVYSNGLTEWETPSPKANGSYVYRVRACNGGVCSDFSAPLTVTVQSGVPALEITRDQQITGLYTASWTEVTGATRYVLKETAPGGGVSEPYSGPGRSWTPLSAKSDGTFSYQVQACNGPCSALSAPVTVTVATEVPGAFSATPNPATVNTAFTVKWSSVTGAATYRLEEKSAAGSWSEIQNQSGTSRLIGGKPLGAWAYRVRACRHATDTAYCGLYADLVVVVRLPSPPTPTVTWAPNSIDTYTVSWGGVTGATRYRLEEARNGSWSEIQSQAGTSRLISGKAPGSYGYKVRACSGTNESDCGDYSGTLTVTVDPPPGIPDTPSSIASNPATSYNGNYGVNWGASSGTAYYELEERIDGGTASVTNTQLERSRDWTNRASGRYAYRARACNILHECSAYTGSVETRVYRTPGKPTLTTNRTLSTDGTFRLDWTQVTDAASHRLEERINNTGSWKPVTGVSGWHMDMVRNDNGRYAYRIQACNNAPSPAICGDFSAIVEVEVRRPEGPAAPTQLKAGQANPRRCSIFPANYGVSWQPSEGAAYYELGETETQTNLSLVHTVTTGSSKQFLKEWDGYAEQYFSYVVRACSSSGHCSAWVGPAFHCVDMGMMRSLPTTTYVHTDGLRSPVAETNASGVVTSSTRYEPYGTVYGSSVAPVQGPGYTGHVRDVDTGLSYMQQRYYDPLAGRFLSVDPIEASAGSFNRYWYANNNPYTNIDPDGRQSSMKDHPSLRNGFQAVYVNAQAAQVEDIAMKNVGRELKREAERRSSVGVDFGAQHGVGLRGTVSKNFAGEVKMDAGVVFGEGASVGAFAELETFSFEIDNYSKSPFKISSAEVKILMLGGIKLKVDVDPGGKATVVIGAGIGFGAEAVVKPVNIGAETVFPAE